MVAIIFILLIVFQIKHFLADYPLQNEFMLGKFKDKGWVIPLATHAGVHAWATFWVSSMFFTGTGFRGLGICISLALLDFTVHFIVDRIKASSKLLGRFKALSALEWNSLNVHPGFTDKDRMNAIRSNKYFWWSLGADQMAHHLTHYLIIYLILKFSF